MPKAFYTERDIEDMVKQGIRSLEINDNVVLTNNAYEKANALGMQLLRDKPDVPPNAPIRPYISKIPSSPAARVQPEAASPAPSPQTDGTQTKGAEIRQRIHQAVIAKLGNQVDSALLDVIITRVFQNTGIK